MPKSTPYKFVLFGIILIFSSCKIFSPDKTGEKTFVIFPAPPDTARIQFLTSISSSADIGKTQSAFSKFIIGEERPVSIAKPFGIDMRFEKIYVCDIGIKGVVIIDLQKKTFDQFIPQGKAALLIPVNCNIDEKGYLYIADSGRKQVVIFDNNLKFVGAIGKTENFKPLDVFVSDNKIWVANYDGHSVNVFKNDTSYSEIISFPDVSREDQSYLFQPKDIHVSNDYVYVSDFGGFKVSVFSKDGKFVKNIGTQGMYPGQFQRVKGICVDKEENLFAVDAAFSNVQIFDNESRLLLFFGQGAKGKGYMYLPAAITINYENKNLFEQYVDPEYDLKYLILVTNQYGTDKINVYGRVELKNK